MISKLWNWIVNDKPSNGLTILIALIGIAGSILSSSLISNKNINNLDGSVNARIDSSLKQIQQIQVVLQNPNSLAEPSILNIETDKSSEEISQASFDIKKWNFSPSAKTDKEGYICPNNTLGFPSWAIWTKGKYLVSQSISLTIALKDKTPKNDKPAALYLSYGDKTNEIPDTFYRVNIFDGDIKTIRLYGRGGSEKIDDDRLKIEPSIDGYITFTLDPIFPNNMPPNLKLNPRLSYTPMLRDSSMQNEEFVSNHDFIVALPFTNIVAQGNGFQYGFGVSEGDCFKVVSNNL